MAILFTVACLFSLFVLNVAENACPAGLTKKNSCTQDSTDACDQTYAEQAGQGFLCDMVGPNCLSTSLCKVSAGPCSVFYENDGTVKVYQDFFQEKCSSIPEGTVYMKLTMGEHVDYLKPKDGKTMCEMLKSNNQHQWSSDLKTWVTPTYYNAATLGGDQSHQNLQNKGPNDNRGHLTLWGSGRSPAHEKGGCCRDEFSQTGDGWGKGYKMEMCSA